VWIVWLPFIIPTIVELFQSRIALPSFMVSLVGIVLFLGVYLWASWRRVQRLVAELPSARDAEAWLPVIVLTALSVVLVLVNGKDWFVLFYFTSGYVGDRFSIVRTLLVMGALILLIVIVGLLIHTDRSVIGQAAFTNCVIGIISFSIVRSIRASWELQAAREEIARLAVTAERLRIARDLHDLLGHNLSLIALKSELARRLVQVAPERAVVEIGDVEQVARKTLQEVREAVASYRQPTLLNELQSAQEILAAAGIAYQYEGDERGRDTLPTAVEAVLSWAVREGVTNVIRHSRRAHLCSIRFVHSTDEVQVETRDDGIGTTPVLVDEPEGTVGMSSCGNRGNGLRGLAERVDVLGGRFDAGPCVGGGFRLVVALPLTPGAKKPGVAAVLPAPHIDGNEKRSEQE
jgi:two-component system sensor histidine kinase DesK